MCQGPEAGGRRAEVGGLSSVIWHPFSVPAVAPAFVLAELGCGRQLLGIRPIVDTVKTLTLVIITATVAIQLFALDMLTISPLGNGYYQIVAPGSSGSPIFPPLACVLQSSTDLVTWTSISTNSFPYTGV